MEENELDFGPINLEAVAPEQEVGDSGLLLRNKTELKM